MEVERLLKWMAERHCQLTVEETEGGLGPIIVIQLDSGPIDKLIRMSGAVCKEQIESASWDESGRLVLTEVLEHVIERTEEAEKEQNDVKDTSESVEEKRTQETSKEN